MFVKQSKYFQALINIREGMLGVFKIETTIWKFSKHFIYDL